MMHSVDRSWLHLLLNECVCHGFKYMKHFCKVLEDQQGEVDVAVRGVMIKQRWLKASWQTEQMLLKLRAFGDDHEASMDSLFPVG